jgi:hypothetical protein
VGHLRGWDRESRCPGIDTFSDDLDKIEIHDGAVSKMMQSIIYEEGSMDWALGGN